MFVVAAMALCLAVATLPSARGEVVYGNMGASGTEGTINFNAQVVATSTSVSAFHSVGSAFTTPSSGLLTLQSVTLALANRNSSPGTISRQIQLLLDNGNQPGTVFATSLATDVIGTTNARYTFNFPTATNLSASTKYWIVPQDTPDYSWWRIVIPGPNTPVLPTAQNSSGYVASGAGGIRASDGQWISTTNSLAVSVVAVPEPATLMLAAIGIVIGGVAVARARSRSASLVG